MMANYLAGFGGDSYDICQDREHAVAHGSVFYPIPSDKFSPPISPHQYSLCLLISTDLNYSLTTP